MTSGEDMSPGKDAPARGALKFGDAAVVIGLMSGTSLDGISAAVARFAGAASGSLAVELLGFTQAAYDRSQRERLQQALTSGAAADYCRLNFDLGHLLAAAATAVLADSGVAKGDVAAVASHGQSIWHEPGHSTWQLGEAAVLAERLKLPVVSDFRVRDVAADGQGAPLVPIADALLFSSAVDWRALQNLGGIGNVTVVPPHGDLSGTRAFDTGPGCGVIDRVARILRPELPYDVDGALAASGSPVEDVLRHLLSEPYFSAAPPKSTGPELFSQEYAARLVEQCRQSQPDCSDGDIVATAVALTARSIGEAYRRFMPEPVAETIVSGGGTRNPALMAAIGRELAPTRVTLFDEVFFDAEAKEAVAFALLGYLHLTGSAGNVPRATGARGPRVLGKYTPA